MQARSKQRQLPPMMPGCSSRTRKPSPSMFPACLRRHANSPIPVIGTLALKVDPAIAAMIWSCRPPRARVSRISQRDPQPPRRLSGVGVRPPHHLGTGLKALFAGASGTGKTMAARSSPASSARPLQDRPVRRSSASTSARPRRTCDRIFDAAENGGAILFFDEADALFGKRSEVKDATTATPTSRSATCCSGWRTTRASRSSRPT